MAKTITKDELIRKIRNFATIVNRDADKYPREILGQIRRFIISTGTIDTTDLLVTYDFYEHVKRGSGSHFKIEPDQRYGRKEGFVEFDRPAYGFTGRRFIKKGIEASNIQRVTNEITFAAFN